MAREHRFANIPKPQSSICTAARCGLPIESWWACWSHWNVPKQGRRQRVFVCVCGIARRELSGHRIAVQLIKPQNLWGVSNPPSDWETVAKTMVQGRTALTERTGRFQVPVLPGAAPNPQAAAPATPLNERTGRFQVPVFPGATPTPPAAPPAAPLNERTGRFQAPVFPGATPTPPAAPPAAPLNERTGRFQVPVFPGATPTPPAAPPAAPLNERTGRFQAPVFPGATPTPPAAPPAAPLNERTGRFQVPVFPGAAANPQATAPAAPLNERTGRFQVPVLPGATPSPPAASPRRLSMNALDGSRFPYSPAPRKALRRPLYPRLLPAQPWSSVSPSLSGVPRSWWNPF